MAYTDAEVESFKCYAQEKIGELGWLAAEAVNNFEDDSEEMSQSFELLDFLEGLTSEYNNWTDAERDLYIDFFKEKYSLGCATIVQTTPWTQTTIGGCGGDGGTTISSVAWDAATYTYTIFTTDGDFAQSLAHTHAWAQVTGTPTTLAGYGITDAQPLDADLTAIAGLAGTDGLLLKTAGTWGLSTAYATIAYADSLVLGLWDDRGGYDASVNTFPATGGSGDAGAILKGDIWTVTVAGTLGGTAVNSGDTIRALTDTPGQTSTNWSILEGNLGYTPVPDTLTLTVAGTANQITSSAGAQDLSANRTWTLSLPDDVILPGTGAVTLPDGTTAQRPTAANGMIRYNTSNDKFEAYEAAEWKDVITTATGVTIGSTEIAYGDASGNLVSSSSFTIVGSTLTAQALNTVTSGFFSSNKIRVGNLTTGLGDNSSSTIPVVNISPNVAGDGAAFGSTIRTSPDDDTGTSPVVQFYAYKGTATPIAVRPVFGWFNYDTKLAEVSAGGDWDFQSNNLSNITSLSATQVSATTGSFATLSVTGASSFSISSIGNSVDDGTESVGLRNPTAAIANVTGDDGQQYSPALRWSGRGWKTDATAGSQEVEFRAYVKPVQGTTAPTGNWVLENSINGGAYSEVMNVSSGGSLSLAKTTNQIVLGTTNTTTISSVAPAASRTYTIPDFGSNDTFVGVAATQTLTNKSLTSPTITGSPTASGATWTSLGTVTTIDINGGTIDETVIGGTTPAAGSFTTLTLDNSNAIKVLLRNDTDLDAQNIGDISWYNSFTNGATEDRIGFIRSRTSGGGAGTRGGGMGLYVRNASADTFTQFLSADNTGAATFSGTVSGAFNGTLGATTPSTVAATTGSFSGNVTFNSALTNPYLFTNRGNVILGIQAQTSGQQSTIETYTKDGDGTDDLGVILFAKGAPSDITNREAGALYYNSASSRFQLTSTAAGTGTVRPFHLYTGTNTSQVVLNIDGSTSFGGDIKTGSTTRISSAGAFTGTSLTLENTTSIIGTNSSDAADNKRIQIAGAQPSVTRGSYINLYGNEFASNEGNLDLFAGNSGIGGAGFIRFSTGNGVEAMRINSSQNVGIGATTWGTSAAKVLAIANGTAPTTAITDGIQLFSVDTGDATATLGMYLEQAVESIGTFTASHKIKVNINGTNYWLQLDQV